MALHINSIEISGNLGSDPEVRATQTGKSVANMSVCSTQQWRDKEGNDQERSTWFKVTVWGWLADVAGRCNKGDMVYVRGPMEEREWEDREGNAQRTMEISAGFAPGSMFYIIDRGRQFAKGGQRSGGGGGFGGGRGGNSSRGFGGGNQGGQQQGGQQGGQQQGQGNGNQGDDEEDLGF